MTPTICSQDQADTLLEFTSNSSLKVVPNLVLVKDLKADSVRNDAYDDVHTRIVSHFIFLRAKSVMAFL